MAISAHTKRAQAQKGYILSKKKSYFDAIQSKLSND